MQLPVEDGTAAHLLGHARQLNLVTEVSCVRAPWRFPESGLRAAVVHADRGGRCRRGTGRGDHCGRAVHGWSGHLEDATPVAIPRLGAWYWPACRTGSAGGVDDPSPLERAAVRLALDQPERDPSSAGISLGRRQYLPRGTGQRCLPQFLGCRAASPLTRAGVLNRIRLADGGRRCAGHWQTNCAVPSDRASAGAFHWAARLARPPPIS